MNGTQLKTVTCLELVMIWKCIYNIWGIPSPWKLDDLAT